MLPQIEQSWREQLVSEFNQEYFKNLTDTIQELYATGVVFPPAHLIFKAFSLCPFPEVNVVIFGQDPYHGLGQAHGLSFSVPDGTQIPPSLRNIYKEVANDIKTTTIPNSGNLEHWAKQGVLLLNATLTVSEGKAGSHQTYGWEIFTDAVIKRVSEKKEHVVFLLWGAFAMSKRPLIDESRHLVLTAPHPSPLSAHRGFLGCRHFSTTNAYLKQHGLSEIIW